MAICVTFKTGVQYMYGLCRVRSTVIEGLAELMNINAETQSERAGAVTKQQPLRSYDAVQMSTRVHVTYNLQNLHFGYQPEDGHPSIGQSILYSLWQQCA